MAARHFFCGCEWIGQPPEKFGIHRELDIYNMYMPSPPMMSRSRFNVYLDSNEPDFYAPCPIDELRERASHFDLILTRRPELLHLKNAKLFHYGTHYLGDSDPTTAYENKKDAISFTTTNKYHPAAYGYRIRHTIGQNIEKLNDISSFQIDGYDSQRFPTGYDSFNFLLGDDETRIGMMKYKFHIAVENCSLPNYTTEKLHDCFLTKTVPIYYGSTNVSDYYNMDGILKFETLDELVDILRNIDSKTYDNMKNAVEENLERFVMVEQDGFYSRFWREIKKASSK